MKAKFKITQLAAKPIDVELIHPTEGDTGIFVKMVGPHSPKLRVAFKEYSDKEVRGDEDHVKLFTACLVGWDEEAFEMPFTPENVDAFFKQLENSWIVEQLAPMIHDHKLFFRTEGSQAP